jgi:hypothetical protein
VCQIGSAEGDQVFISRTDLADTKRHRKKRWRFEMNTQSLLSKIGPPHAMTMTNTLRQKSKRMLPCGTMGDVKS